MFIKAHKTACDLLAEARPDYGDRRLGSQAIPLAIFLLIEEDVEETDDEAVKALFVEAFGDRQTFFNVCVKELEKSEAIIEIHMDRTNYVGRDEVSHDDIDDDELVPESQEDKLNVLLDTFKDKDLVILISKCLTNLSHKTLLLLMPRSTQTSINSFKSLNLNPMMLILNM